MDTSSDYEEHTWKCNKVGNYSINNPKKDFKKPCGLSDKEYYKSSGVTIVKD